jgi:MraZ protein
MYLGRFKTYFSGKNRLILPKKLRKELGNEEKFYIILGLDGEIWGFDVINWHKLAEKVLEAPLFTREGIVERRKLFANADECILDGQGRFIVPQEFIDLAGLDREIVLVGAGDHFEIWDQKKWSEIQKNVKSY